MGSTGESRKIVITVDVRDATARRLRHGPTLLERTLIVQVEGGNTVFIRSDPHAFPRISCMRIPSIICSGTLPPSLARKVRTHMQLPTRAERPTERRATCPPPSSVSATCLPTAYGRSLESLCACKIPVRTAPVTCASVAQQRLRAGIVVPKEIWRLTGALYERLALGGRDERLFVSYGDEREVREIRECVDTGAALASSGTLWRPHANACVHARTQGPYTCACAFEGGVGLLTQAGAERRRHGGARSGRQTGAVAFASRGPPPAPPLPPGSSLPTHSPSSHFSPLRTCFTWFLPAANPPADTARLLPLECRCAWRVMAQPAAAAGA